MKLKIIIIGSRGFIGSYCYSRLNSNSDFNVFGADVVVQYNIPNYFLIDASNSNFKDVFKNQKFDWCINCSGAASVSDSYTFPLRDYLLNVHHVVLLLNAIKDENPSCKFIQISSAAVYGNPSKLPVSEYQPLSPLSPYGIHKKQAEEICKLYEDYFGIKSYIVRIFSAYGIDLKKQLFWELYQKSLLTNTIELFGTGKETRDYINIEDISQVIELIISSIKDFPSVINVANGEAISTLEAAETLLSAIKFKGKLRFNGVVRKGDPLYWEADVQIIKNLGYRQRVKFISGINSYGKWLKEKE